MPVRATLAHGSDTMRAPTARSAASEAGFTLIDMLFIVALIGLLSTLAIPGVTRARVAAQAGSALGTMRLINGSQLSFAITCGLGFYAPDLPTLGVKPPGAQDAFLPSDLSSGLTVIKGGYNFSMALTPVAGAPASCNGLAAGETGPGYALVADPVDVTPTARFFGTNADGVLYQHSASLAATMPEAGPPPVGGPIK
jgi:hypothetical protein